MTNQGIDTPSSIIDVNKLNDTIKHNILCLYKHIIEVKMTVKRTTYVLLD